MNRIKPSGPITASFVLAALAAQACGSTDGPEKTEAPATSGTAVSANVKLASGVRLSSQLAADLERGGPSIGVQIHLADAPLPEDDEVDVGSATLEHGEVIAGTLNDQPATARDFAD